MAAKIMETVEQAYLKKNPPKLQVGDTVSVSVRIVEGQKERTQVFTGTVISLKGRAVNRMFTVRRIVNNEGVERIFPLNSPQVLAVKVVRTGHVRRAKLYYLRERIGKSVRLRDKRRGLAPKPARAGRSKPQQPAAEPAAAEA